MLAIFFGDGVEVLIVRQGFFLGEVNLFLFAAGLLRC